MKYCTKCGNKLEEASKFCTKCGNPTNLGLEKIEKEKAIKKEESNERLLLKLGVSLIIMASIIFAFVTWDEASDLFKVCFLAIESLIFVLVAVAAKKLGSNNSCKAFLLIGMLLIPIVMLLIPEYGLISSYISSGAGLYVYLSICSLICIILYFISYKYVKANTYLYFNCFLINMFILFVMLIFNLDTYFNDNADIVFNVILLFNLVLSIICIINKDNKYSKIFINFMKFGLVFLLPFIIAYTTTSVMYVATHIIANLIYISLCYIIVLYNKKSVFNNFVPFILVFVSLTFVNELLDDYNNMSLYFTSLSLILSLIISYALNIKSFKIITLIINIFVFIYVLGYSISYNYIVSAVISAILIITSIFLSKTEESNSIKNVYNVIIPILLYVFIVSLVSSFIVVKTVYILISASLIYSIIYAFLVIMKNKKLSVYEWLSYILLTFAIFPALFNSNKVASIIIEVLWIYYYIFKMLFNDQKYIRNYLYIMAMFNLILVCANFDIRVYYTLLIVSFLLISINFINKGKNNVSYVFGVILLVIASLFNFNNYNIVGLLLNLVVYVSVYYLSFIKNKTNFIYKFFYVMLGFLIITKIITSLIDEMFISSLISLILSIIILITMFLAETDSDRKVLSYTIYLIYPYSMLINSVAILEEYSELMILSLITVYVFILFEKLLNVKKNDKTVLEVIWLVIIFLNFMSVSNIVNIIYLLVLSVILIFMGVTLKRTPFIYYGSITLIINAFIQFMNFNTSLAIVVTLLALGIILVQYVFIKEIKKGKK